MKFVRIVHEDESIKPAVVSEAAARAHAQRGWRLDELVDDPTPVDDGPRKLKRPQKNDSTPAWRTYAVALGVDNGGLTVAEAFDMSRDEIVAKYAPAEKPAPTPRAPRKRARKAAAKPAQAPQVPANDPTDTSTAPAKTDTKES